MIFKPTNQRPVDDDEYDEQNFSISVEDSVIEIKLNNPLLKDGASVVVSPSCSVFDCQEFLDYMTSTCLPFIIYAIEHDSLTDQVQTKFSSHVVTTIFPILRDPLNPRVAFNIGLY